jgi:hypothetical protein
MGFLYSNFTFVVLQRQREGKYGKQYMKHLRRLRETFWSKIGIQWREAVRGKGARNEMQAPKNGDTDFVVLVFESSRDNFKTRRNRNDSRREWNVDLSEVLSAAASERGGCVWVRAGCAPCLRALPFGSAGSSIAEMQQN